MNISEFEDAYEDVESLGSAIVETPVSEVMAVNPIVVDADATVVDAVNAMNEHRTGCVLVQKDGKLVGIFTERDLLRRVIFRDGNRAWKVESVMTEKPDTLPPNASVAFALNRMSVDGYRHIPIVDEFGKAIGLVSIKDIVNLLVDSFPASVLNLPPNAERSISRGEDGG